MQASNGGEVLYRVHFKNRGTSQSRLQLFHDFGLIDKVDWLALGDDWGRLCYYERTPEQTLCRNVSKGFTVVVTVGVEDAELFCKQALSHGFVLDTKVGADPHWVSLPTVLDVTEQSHNTRPVPDVAGRDILSQVS